MSSETYIVAKRMTLVVDGKEYKEGDEIELTEELARAIEGKYVVKKGKPEQLPKKAKPVSKQKKGQKTEKAASAKKDDGEN